MRVNYNHINKEDFLHIIPDIHNKALTAANIYNGFAAAGIVPISPNWPLSKLNIYLCILTLPPALESALTPILPLTPYMLYLTGEVKHKFQTLHSIINAKKIWPSFPSSLITSHIEQIAKGFNQVLKHLILLEQENKALRAENTWQKAKKGRKRHILGTNLILTVGAIREHIQ